MSNRLGNRILAFERSLSGARVPRQYQARIRAEQKNLFQRMLPYGLAGSALNAVIVLLTLIASAHSPSLLIWFAVISAVSVVGLRSGLIAMKRKSEATSLKASALRRPLFESAIFAYAWGMAPLLLLPDASGSQLAVLMTVAAGMMAGGAYTISSIPRAASLFVTIVALGFAVGLIRRGLDATEIGLLCLIVTYTIVMLRAIYWNFGSHCEAWLQKIRLAEQATELEKQNDVISILLKDFEESAADCLWQTDEAGRFFDVSPPIAKLCNLSVEEMSSIGIMDLIQASDTEHPGELEHLVHCIQNRRGFSDRFVSHRVRGENRWWSVSGKPIYRAGKFAGYRGVVADITDAHNADARIAYLAHYDALTDLPNRAHFNEQLERSLYAWQADKEPFCIVTLDLDFFKTVNDVHGHDIGDLLLKKAAGLMKENLCNDGFIARIGGDEFAIIQRNIKSRRHAMAVCDTLVEALSHPMTIKGLHLQVGASLGVAFCPEDSQNISDLMKFSDLALYRAKKNGRGCVRYFESDMDSEARERRQLEMELRTALQSGQFELHYQPLVDTKTGDVISYEALLRWNHPERGTVSPEQFISITEQTGLIVSIGEWVIRTALAEVATWDTDAKISINLSPVQVRHKSIVSTVTQALAQSQIVPNRVEFEITESVLLDDNEASMQRLRDLKSLGVLIALDDFGTGYSSLSYLRLFPFDKIKIDKSFVHAMDDSLECRAIVQAVTSLAKTLGISSTAEGVETQKQVDDLTKNGCDELQGFFFSQPKSSSDLQANGLLKKKDAKPNDVLKIPHPNDRRSQTG